MNYRDMIKKIQDYSGLSDNESENALTSFIKTLASRLTSYERMDFASELPPELQSEVISTDEMPDVSMKDMLETMADEQHIDESQAHRQLTAVWKMLKDALTPGQIDHLKSQLPQDVVGELS